VDNTGHVFDAVGNFQQDVVRNMDSRNPLARGDDQQLKMGNGYEELANSLMKSDLIRDYSVSTRAALRTLLEGYVGFWAGYLAGLEMTPIDHILMTFEESEQTSIVKGHVELILMEEINLQTKDFP